MPILHAQIKHHQQWQLPLVCPSPLWRKERDSSERLRELVSPDCALGQAWGNRSTPVPQAVGQQPVRHSAEALLVSTGQGEELHPQGITALAKIGRKE